MKRYKFTVEVTEHELDQMVATIKRYNKEVVVLDKVKLAQIILEEQASNLHWVVGSEYLDEGGNCLIGDCFDEATLEGVAYEHFED